LVNEPAIQIPRSVHNDLQARLDHFSSKRHSFVSNKDAARADRSDLVEIERATGMFQDAKPLAGGLMSRHSPFKNVIGVSQAQSTIWDGSSRRSNLPNSLSSASVPSIGIGL
jgi:hypothetical protein